MNDLISQTALPSGSPTLEPATVPFFLVQESNFLIAEDIIASLRSLAPCDTVHVLCPSEVLSALAGARSVSAIFLEARYVEVLEMKLDSALTEFGALIILTAERVDELKARALGWGILSRPFTEAMIHRELKAVRV
jgi:hypothetical protein